MLEIFIGLICAWTSTSLLWPTFVGMLAVASSGIYIMTSFAAISFGHETVVFIILITAFASVIFFWTILYTVCKEFDIRPYEKYPSLMIFGIVFASMTAGLTVFPFRITALIVIAPSKLFVAIILVLLFVVAFGVGLPYAHQTDLTQTAAPHLCRQKI